MSLILDALRRADAERGRGAVPGLHTPQAVTPAASSAAASRLPAVALAVLVCAVAAGLGLGWWWQARTAVPAATERVVLAAAPAPAVPAAPTAPTAPVVSTAPAAAPVPPAPLAPLQSRNAAPPARVAATFAAAAPAAVAPAQLPVPPPAIAEAAVPAPTTRVPMLQDLPAAARQQLPQLAVSGASYSSNPAWRMVIVNGQVLHEGDEAAAGVVLESIAARQVVLRGHGQRWAVAY